MEYFLNHFYYPLIYLYKYIYKEVKLYVQINANQLKTFLKKLHKER